jgi:L,D-transpeptidase ErfK/SrfK
VIKIVKLITVSILIFFFKLAFATTLIIPPTGNIVGDVEYAFPNPGETLGDVGIRYDMGYQEMVKANPNVDPQVILSPRMRLLIPSQFTLPNVPHQGLVINLSDYRLYFFPENDNVVMTYPVGIGRKGWSTPCGVTKIIAKQANPTWHPTTNVQAYAAEHGVLMPDRFPPGQGNPLGKHVLRLGWPTYLIHGSNSDGGIGERVSAGCIRMLAEDIEYLFGVVQVGTPVRIVKVG